MSARLNETRELEALRELGSTSVGRGSAWLLVGAFLATLALVPVLEVAGGKLPSGSPFAGGLPGACALEAFERDLEDASVVGARVRPALQTLLLGAGLGNEQVYPGKGGWLFHRPGFDYATGPGFLEPDVLARRVRDADPCAAPPQPDPRVAIRDFDAQLRARGVRLFLLPVPVKAVVAPARLARRDAPAPLQNPSWAAFLRALDEAGVAYLDPAPLLLGDGDYLATDTHWSPAAMERVAGALAGALGELGVLSPPGAPAARGEATARNRGDLAGMLDLAAWGSLPLERVRIRPLAEPARARDPRAEVLLLGDSFSNVYSSREAFAQGLAGEDLDWGADAGLAEQLAHALGRPVDRIVRNAGGAHATRDALARELARASGDALAGRRVVVWQFAVRELAQGDWRAVALPASASGSGPTPRAAPAGAEVRGTVAARSDVPRPGSVPYADALFAIHLVDVEGAGDAGEIVVYVYGMRDHALTGAARWKPGERVALHLEPWEREDVQRDHASRNRTELDDLSLLALPTWYGVPVEAAP